MSHIPELKQTGNRIAVGWLHPDHQFPHGPSPPDFIERLTSFAQNWGKSITALGWGAAGGFHECEFCIKDLRSRRIGKDMASGTFGVPAGDKIYCCPEMIAHYVADHAYLPPSEFVQAIMECPLPGTPEYAKVSEPFAIKYK